MNPPIKGSTLRLLQVTVTYESYMNFGEAGDAISKSTEQISINEDTGTMALVSRSPNCNMHYKARGKGNLADQFRI